MKIINAVTIGKLIEACIENDVEKFLSYANFIAEAYDEIGEKQSAEIIRSKLNESNKNKSKVQLDKFVRVKYFYQKNGEEYTGPVYFHGNNEPFTDPYGNIIECRYI
jgi:uncharacterized alpha/beta hydrolase family protein